MANASPVDTVAASLKHALLVEDEAPIRRMLEKTLQKNGYTVDAVGHGEEGWSLFQEKRHPLVILDWMLPGITGIEICKRIRQAPEGEFTTILIETARTGLDDLLEALRAGADDYLMKPISMQLFQVRLATAEGAMREKSGRHIAETMLRESEEMYRMLVHALPDMVYKLDEEGLFTFVSEAADQFGYAPDDLVGKHFREILASGDASELSRAAVLPRYRGKTTGPEGAPKLFDERRDRSRKTAHLEVHIRPGESLPTASDSDLVAEVNACGMYDEGEESSQRPFLATTGIVRDVTARKEMERALILSERLAAVGTLAGGVAHEFNNIHAIIKGYLELARDNEGLSEKVREYLDVAYESTLQGAEVTHSLLAFCGRKRGSKRATHLDQVVENTIKIVRREFESEGITVKTELAEVPPLTADPTQIGQVLMNLIINARHAMLGTHEKQLAVTTGTERGRAYVRVSDTGCGIPADILSRIFDPFFTTKGERTEGPAMQPKIKGIGLGLSVGNSIAQEHGGEITVTSGPQKGSTFTLWLPIITPDANEEAVAPAAGRKTQHAALQDARILILDDERHLRRLFNKILVDLGADVVTTDDGNQALQLHQEKPFDLFLVDLQMPKVPGTEFLLRLKEQVPKDRAAAIVITGRQAPEDLATCEALDVFDTVAKPFDTRHLLERIAAALVRHKGQA